MKDNVKEKNIRQGNLADDIILTFLMTFVFSAYSYEPKLSEGTFGFLKWLVLAAFILTWVIVAVKNGIEKKKGFIIYSFICWILPQILILLFYHGPQFLRHSVFMYTLSEFSGIFSTRPAEVMGEYCGITVEMSFVIILMAVAGSFFAGYAYSNDKEKQEQQ